MKKKTDKVTEFIEGLHKAIVRDFNYRIKPDEKSESEIQTEIRPIIIEYLKKHFERAGYKDAVAKANKSFYWEGEEGRYGRTKASTFGTRNYPDFIITKPYLLAIEYKKSPSGSTVKHGIGQSMMHTMCEEFHYVYFLFHDESEDLRILNSLEDKIEKFVIDKMWDDFNVFIRFFDPKEARHLKTKT